MACGNNSIHGCRLQTTKSKVPQDETYSERHTNTFASILLHFKRGWKQASWTLIHHSDLRPTEGYASQRPSTVPRVPNLPGAAHAWNSLPTPGGPLVSRTPRLQGDARACCPVFFITRAWFFSRTHARLASGAGDGKYASPPPLWCWPAGPAAGRWRRRP